MRRFLPLYLAFGIFPLLYAAGVAMPRAITLTAQENGTVPQDEFSCSGKIHGYLVLPKKAIGDHILEGIWTKPDGKAASHSRNEVHFPPPGRSTAYVWFHFP